MFCYVIKFLTSSIVVHTWITVKILSLIFKSYNHLAQIIYLSYLLYAKWITTYLDLCTRCDLFQNLLIAEFF